MTQNSYCSNNGFKLLL